MPPPGGNQNVARPTSTLMKRFTVLYDQQCGLCRHCRAWLEAQPQLVRLEFLPFQHPAVPCRFPGIEAFQPQRQLVLVADDGGVYTGDAAWIMCLYALDAYRAWSLRLARPTLRPLARRVCEAVSKRRLDLSRLLGLGMSEENDASLAHLIRRSTEAPAPCAVPPPLPTR